MPFRKAEIKHATDYIDDALYAESPPQTILQDINMARMVGVLHQLGHLATHATTLFEDLYDEARKTKERLDQLSSRVAAVAADVAPTEDLVYATRDPVARFGGLARQDSAAEHCVPFFLFSHLFYSFPTWFSHVLYTLRRGAAGAFPAGRRAAPKASAGRA